MVLRLGHALLFEESNNMPHLGDSHSALAHRSLLFCATSVAGRGRPIAANLRY